VVGIGPGAASWRTPEASRALAGADHVVGHGLYLDLIADSIDGKARHVSPLGEEEARVAKALDLAASGESVALVSSGDPGIFALAALVFELLERRDHGPWNRVEITVVPGVSAFQAAAARLGAPMGHDFCVISLSDLLTPWAAIRRRLRAAAEGDFIVALYNPASERRKKQLTEARDILLSARDEDTPVAVARNLGRDGERTDIVSLGQLDSGHADMLSVILVGNSRTRVTERGTKRWVYTPRGYEMASP
jgi:cobalt-precorrin 5A hydrolase/precorrin-3B C17-methyltransferase